MNRKPLAMLAITGLALSFATIAPAFADDLASAGQTQTGQAANQVPANDAMQTANNSTDTVAPAAIQPDAAAASGSADEGTPDTATGDDDY